MTGEVNHPHAGMTDRQRKYLEDLCRQHDAPFNGTLTQAEARYVIAGMLRAVRPGREQIRSVECPECFAPPGEGCVNVHGKPRQRHHIARISGAPRKTL